MSQKKHKGLAFPPLVLGARLPDLHGGETRPDVGDYQPSAAPEPLDLRDEPILPAGIEDMFRLDPAPEKAAAFDAAQPMAKSDAVDREIEALPLLESPAKRKEKAAKANGDRPAKMAKPQKPSKTERRALRDLADAPAAVSPASSAGPAPTRLPIWARLAYPSAFLLAVIWTGVMIAFTSGYQNRFGPFEYRPFPVVVFTTLAMLPAVFILLGAYVLRQAAKLSLETRRARDLADELAIPAALAVDQAAGAADAVRREVARATEAGEAAERQLLSLRQALADESDRLVAVTAEAQAAAHALTESLSRERTEMSALTAGLDGQVEAVNRAIVGQAQIVAQSADLAAAQMHEAEASLAARATDLAAAAGEAGEAAELAGEALSRQAERLETMGELVGERLQILNEGLGRGHSRLADLAVQLQADQQSLSDRLDAQRHAAETAQVHAANATGGAEAVAASLRDLIAEADARLRSVGEQVQGEQAALDARARASLSLFRDAVSEERASIEAEANGALASLRQTADQTRAAAEASAESARAKMEQLGEAAFAAGQAADHAFDTRITAARRAIEQAAALVDEAGQRSVGRIDAGLDAARQALTELEAMLAAVDSRIAAAPLTARAQAETVRAAVETGLNEIAAHVRKTATETEAVDAAFQERVRRNYEMLSEALKTMGKVAQVTEQAAARTAAPSAAAAPTPAAAAFAERAIRVPPSAPLAAPVQQSAASPVPTHASAIPAAPEPSLRPAALSSAPPLSAPLSSAEAGLRPRLRLTPESELFTPTPMPAASATLTSRPPAPRTHDNLDAFQKPVSTATPQRDGGQRDAGGHTSAWTWKDLLSSIDEPPIDDEVLAERLISEIEGLGLDAATLLPLSQIDAIAVAMQKGDVSAVREAVRALAPGAVRRLSRRVLTDKVLRAQADRYVRRYEDLLNDSAKRDREGFMTAALLGSEPGRAFLLFDAAVGELH